MTADHKIAKNPRSLEFCTDFLNAETKDRLILGRNSYGRGIAEKIEIGAFIDDFTFETEYLNKPVIKSSEIPKSGLVVSSLLGKPLSGEKKLQEVGARHLDYFAFYEDSGLNLPVVRFWGGFKEEFRKHYDKFYWIESLLVDNESKMTFSNIINFRLSGNLDYMRNFCDREKDQYFEEFLKLKVEGEVFVDVGGYDGYTSLEFIRRYPDYRTIYFFEPDAQNMKVAHSHLGQYENVHMIQAGLAAHKNTVKFSPDGSVSAISNDGNAIITVDTLDALVSGKVSFIKMDIEGAEIEAIAGAKSSIEVNHPSLAVSVYHKDDDFWRIPELVLSIREDYGIYLRHYTEGVAETIMFFVPK